MDTGRPSLLSGSPFINCPFVFARRKNCTKPQFSYHPLYDYLTRVVMENVFYYLSSPRSIFTYLHRAAFIDFCSVFQKRLIYSCKQQFKSLLTQFTDIKRKQSHVQCNSERSWANTTLQKEDFARIRMYLKRTTSAF